MINEEQIVIRPIAIDDIDKGYFELLSQLTTAEKPSKELFKERVEKINKRNCERILVCEYVPEKKIIGTITTIIELKFIHGMSKVAHVEDFVVDSEYRKMKLGTKLIQLAIESAKKEGCYKIILDCNDSVKAFYEKVGFIQNNYSMQLYFK